jgi:hypothetical protein
MVNSECLARPAGRRTLTVAVGLVTVLTVTTGHAFDQLRIGSPEAGAAAGFGFSVSMDTLFGQVVAIGGPQAVVNGVRRA